MNIIKNSFCSFLQNLFLYIVILATISIPLYLLVPKDAFIGLVGVIAGSIISYFGVKDGLRHTSKENKIQRSIEIRKEVYFKLSESFAKMQAMLISISKTDLNTINADINLINDLQKIEIIANIHLLKKVNICSSYYQKALQEMIFDKMEIDAINNNAKYALDRHSEYLELMKLYPNNLTYLNELNQKLDNCLKYHSEITEDLPQKVLELTKKSITHSSEFGKLLSDCVPEIRKDIETTFNLEDEELYQKFTQESVTKNLKSGIKFLEDLKRKINKIDIPDL